jgi:purine nucleosidase
LNWWSRRDGCYFKKTGETGIPPDPVAMAVALDPTICVDASDHDVDDEVTSELTRGMTTRHRREQTE